MEVRFDSFELKKDKAEKVPNTAGVWRYPVRATRSGIFIYRYLNNSIVRELKDPKEAFHPESLKTLSNLPVTDNHPPEFVTPKNYKEYMRGMVTETPKVKDPYIETFINVIDPELNKKILNGTQIEISMGYECEVDPTPGMWNGQIYDAIQRKIVYNHLAVVEMGRAGPEVKIKLDGKEIIGVFGIFEKVHGGTKTMAIYRFDGVDIELSSDKDKQILEQKINSITGDLTNAKKQAETIQGKLDNTLDELEKAKKIDINSMVKERAEYLKKVDTLLDNLDEEVRQTIDGLSNDRQVQEAIIKAYNKDAKFDGQSDERIIGRFDALFDTVKSGEKDKKENSYEKLADNWRDKTDNSSGLLDLGGIRNIQTEPVTMTLKQLKVNSEMWVNPAFMGGNR